MPANEIGSVKSPKGKTFKVLWDDRSHDVYVKDSGGFISGGSTVKCPTRAGSPTDAMYVAEAFVRDR